MRPPGAGRSCAPWPPQGTVACQTKRQLANSMPVVLTGNFPDRSDALQASQRQIPNSITCQIAKQLRRDQKLLKHSLQPLRQLLQRSQGPAKLQQLRSLESPTLDRTLVSMAPAEAETKAAEAKPVEKRQPVLEEDDEFEEFEQESALPEVVPPCIDDFCAPGVDAPSTHGLSAEGAETCTRISSY